VSGRVSTSSCRLDTSKGRSDAVYLVIWQTQLRKGFSRVESEMGDVQLDHPKAPKLLAAFRDQAVQEGWLTEEESAKSAEA